jgi:hypothetical protein
VPPAGLAPGWPRAGPDGGGSPAAGIPPRRQRRRSRPHGQGSMSFSRRVLHMDPCPWPAQRQGRRRDGIPAPAPHVLRQRRASLRLDLGRVTPSCRHRAWSTPTQEHATTLTDLGSCPSRARSHGDPRGTTGTNGRNLTESPPEQFPAHIPLWAAPLQGGTRAL